MAAVLRRRILDAVSLSVFLIAACSQHPPASTQTGNQKSWAAVYFSDPNALGAEFLQGGPDEPLQAAIEAARLSVDVAAYDLNLYNIRDALIAAQERGLQVRLVIESDNLADVEIQQMIAAGIPVVSDKDSDYMHDKFVLIDRYEVWSGSMNYTLSDAYGNRNNLIVLRSTRLAENYLAEFEEMFVQGLFGAGSPRNTPYPQVEVDGHLVETYFSPEDDTQERLVDLLNGAQESIYFLAFSLTSDELASALVAAQQRGVEVRGVMDKSQASNQGGEFENLAQHGIDVRLDGEGGSMHNKVLIIDGAIVVTGSYNFSANAEESNDENSLIIYDADLAKKYSEEFWRIWKLALK